MGASRPPGQPMPLRLPAGPEAPLGVTTLAADLFQPAHAGEVAGPPVLVTCLPGGGMNRRYFDLDVDPSLGLGSFSMARHMAERGFHVLIVDPPGVGESDIPDDGWALTTPAVADAVGHAASAALHGLATGSLDSDVAPTGPLASIGVGHSAGALVTCYQQARRRTHLAVGLLGFGGAGLRGHLNADELACADDPEATRVAIVSLSRARFRRPFPRGTTSRSELLNRPDVADAAYEAIATAGDALLSIVGLTSMIPGASSGELGAIDVPVFLGVGSHDITGPAHHVPSVFESASDITVYVVPETGHNHNIAPNRELLWDRLADWIHDTVRRS